MARRLSGSDAAWGDSEQHQMQSKLEKAHTELRIAQQLTKGPAGWLSVPGMKIVNDLLESHPYPAIHEAMRLHGDVLGLAAGQLSKQTSMEIKPEFADESVFQWLKLLSDRIWNLSPQDAVDSDLVVQSVAEVAESAKVLSEAAELLDRAWKILDVSRMSEISVLSDLKSSGDQCDEGDWRSSSWIHKATDKALNTDTLLKAYKHGRIKSIKRNRKRFYLIDQVKREWPEQAARIDAAIAAGA